MKTEKECFLGFEDPSLKLRELWYRWKALEVWIELAIRPKNLHPDDRCVLVNDDGNQDDESCMDDLGLLKRQCLHVQSLFNAHLSKLKVEKTCWESSLVVKPSQIPGAGMGLYFQPPAMQEVEQQYQNLSESVSSNTDVEKICVLPSGSTVCYYTGHVHTHSSASTLTDKSYLMWIRGNTLVDPRCLSHIQARYMNDPLNDKLVNCAYDPRKTLNNGNITPHEDTIRTSVVTTRDIQPGEELFVRYGDVYWDQQPIVGRRFVLDSSGKHSGANKNNEEEFGDSSLCNEDENSEDDEGYLDETFPFSPLFQSKLSKPILWENGGSGSMKV